MIKICSIAFLSLLLSASSLFAQTKTFAGADYSQGIVFVMENNQMVWKHKAPDSNDCGYCLTAISSSPPDTEYSK
ncbi:hypothetical protein OXV74_29050 [Bacteroides thetaiotaomicron]|nr:hypothetical protein [Bacteroides thetaiotaomicron]